MNEEEVALLNKTSEEFLTMSDRELAEAGVAYYKVFGLLEDEEGNPITTDYILENEDMAELRSSLSSCYENMTLWESLLEDFKDYNSGGYKDYEYLYE